MYLHRLLGAYMLTPRVCRARFLFRPVEERKAGELRPLLGQPLVLQPTGESRWPVLLYAQKQEPSNPRWVVRDEKEQGRKGYSPPHIELRLY